MLAMKTGVRVTCWDKDGYAIPNLSLIQSRYPGTCTISKRKFGTGDWIAYGTVDGKRYTVLYPQAKIPKLELPKSARPTITPSVYNQAILEAFNSSTNHLAIQALAGSGKTYQLELLSKQGNENWHALAFNTRNAEDFLDRLSCPSSTFHGLCLNILTSKTPTIKINHTKLNKIIKEVTQDNKLFYPIYHLAKLAKNCAVQPHETELLDCLLDHTLVTIELGNVVRSDVVELCSQVLKKCYSDVQTVDFDDMVWFVALDCAPLPKKEVILVDEAQDQNRANIEIICRFARNGSRIVIIGDSLQSMYGFRGVEGRSMSILLERLPGCQVLSLPINYRSSHAVIQEAQTLVPEIQVHEGAEEGEVRTIGLEDMYERIEPGDAILCRVNAPNLALALHFLERGRKIRLLGKNDLGCELIGFIEQLQENRCLGIVELVQLVDQYQATKERELGGKWWLGMQLEEIRQKCQCIRIIAQGQRAQTSEEAIKLLNELFYDGEDPTTAINLMSIHKSKGFEFRRVYLVRPDLLPHPKAVTKDQLEQERNMRYVAITRARVGFYYVTGDPRE